MQAIRLPELDSQIIEPSNPGISLVRCGYILSRLKRFLIKLHRMIYISGKLGHSANVLLSARS